MGATFSRFFVEAPGNTILAAHYNGEFDNILTNFTPDGMDDASADLTAFKTMINPGEDGTESLPNDLTGELERLRFMFTKLAGTTNWYDSPVATLADLAGTPTVASVTVDEIKNFGLILSSGTLSTAASDGTALSTSNFGSVTMRSVASATQYVRIKNLAPSVLKDVTSGASSLTGIGFGIAKTASWAPPMPFFVYQINKGDTDDDGTDGTSTIAISRFPWLTQTPSSANSIGSTASAPATDNANAILVLKTITKVDYINLPMKLIGYFRMSYALGSTDWTIGNIELAGGIGDYAIQQAFATDYSLPISQGNATNGYFFYAGSDQVPVFTDNVTYYRFVDAKHVEVTGYHNGDGGTDGSGATPLSLSIPFPIVAFEKGPVGYGFFSSTAGVQSQNFSIRSDGTRVYMYVQVLAGSNLTNATVTLTPANFGTGDRLIRYKHIYSIAP